MATVVLAAAVGVSAMATGAAASGEDGAAVDDAPETATPIRHFVTLMQENHSFDNYFGMYPGADGIPEGTCMPVDPEVEADDCVKPFWMGETPLEDPGHSPRVFRAQYRDGEMDGFVSVMAATLSDPTIVMGYYDDRDLPYYWNVVDEYVLFDRFFSSAAGGSVWNHMYWVSGSPGDPGDDSIPDEGFDVPTIFDRLEEAGVSWKFYVQNYDSTINLYNPGSGDRAAQVIWTPLLNFPRFLDDPDLFAKIVPLEEFYSDLERGTLPAVSYIVPAGASEHPPGSIRAGERFVRTLINALMRSSVWEDVAFTWTYDDWGGWYDHVPPPRVDSHGYGFRVPALLVSPYARRGHVDSTVLDFTSYLKFIEHNWGLEPLAERDANANDLLSAFDFDAPPRPPVLLDRERTETSTTRERPAVVYVSYGAALLLPTALITFGILLGRGRRPRRRGDVFETHREPAAGAPTGNRAGEEEEPA